MLNFRDRREAVLLEAMWRLAPRALRDLIAIQARVAVLSRNGVVDVHTWGGRGDELWPAIVRWGAALPPGVRLRVNESVDGGLDDRRLRVQRTWRIDPHFVRSPS